MAFFGLTHLGYQNPIGDKMIITNPSRPSRIGGIQSRETLEEQGPLRSTEECTIHQKPLPYSPEIHQGSHARYKEMTRRIQTPRSPKELYLMPLTDNQQYGWLLSQSSEPWRQVKRFPLKNSEMTKFVTEMTKTDPEFTLF